MRVPQNTRSKEEGIKKHRTSGEHRAPPSSDLALDKVADDERWYAVRVAADRERETAVDEPFLLFLVLVLLCLVVLVVVPGRPAGVAWRG
jgi:hypothetical protein